MDTSMICALDLRLDSYAPRQSDVRTRQFAPREEKNGICNPWPYEPMATRSENLCGQPTIANAVSRRLVSSVVLRFHTRMGKALQSPMEPNHRRVHTSDDR